VSLLPIQSFDLSYFIYPKRVEQRWKSWDDGNVLGLQITLFDAIDPVNPVDIDRFVVRNNIQAALSSGTKEPFGTSALTTTAVA
jgi:hypothetical protein